MCLLVLAWRQHPSYRLVVAANRDEFHERPAAPLAPWSDIPGVVGGRDLQASGTWLAFDSRRRCGFVTNFREFGRRRRSAPSRGGLIPAWLAGTQSAADYLRSLETDAPGYAGFNLLLADRDSLWYASNRADQFARELEPGIYGLSNEFLDTPWPKLIRTRARFESLLADSGAGERRHFLRGLLAMLDDRETAAPEALPPSELPGDLARKLSSPFVLDPLYGTRCSTALTVARDGSLDVVERNFDAGGTATGETEYALNATHD
jgi:uncharacterized protein with NRDE domain